MGFVKVVKNRAYFKRFQVKFRRRREAKTDYYARKRLIIQDKNKYKSPKYRFVVRFSNKDVTCQIIRADLNHDEVVACAYAHELPRYGIKLGLTNYAAAYATGLLLARRVNQKFGLKEYTGNTEVNGEDYLVEAKEDGPAPFRAYLDVGLARTTTGARIFGALKGACDGGLNIPHNERRYPGSGRDDEGNWSFDPEVHKKYIFGGHVGEYMNALKDDEEAFKRQFGRYADAGITAEKLAGLYKKAHAEIRKDPTKKRAGNELGRFKTTDKVRTAGFEYPKKRHSRVRLSAAQRRSRIRQKLTAAGKQSIGPANADV